MTGCKLDARHPILMNEHLTYILPCLGIKMKETFGNINSDS